jgi:ABC-type bacteriocin/lantibiotic exporter with double-glycine peptidase domain
MAEDTNYINGVGADAIGPQMEAGFAVILGICFGFYFCWEEALICLALTPLLMISKVIRVKITHGISSKQGDLNKDANIFCSDCICNFKTVQSFGHIDVITKQYQNFLDPTFKYTTSK